MNPIDDLFRDGLGGRKPEVPADMWARVNAGRAKAPEGAEMDKLFSDALKERKPEVPADMWSRITASGVPAPATIDQTFVEGLADLRGPVPNGMWDKIWAARTQVPGRYVKQWWTVAAAILLLSVATWWLLPNNNTVGPNDAATATESVVPTDQAAETKASRAKTASLANKETSTTETGSLPESKLATRNPATPQPATGNPQRLTANPQPATNNPQRTTRTQQPITENLPPTSSDGPPAAPYPTTVIPQLATRNRPPATVTPKLATEKEHHRPRKDRLYTKSFRAAPRHRAQLEFLFGAFYADQRFRARTADQARLRLFRDNDESPDLSYQVTLRGSYNLGRRFQLLGGLTYAEIRNSFSYTQVLNGQAFDIRTTNRLRMLEAPVLLGLRLPGRRMQVSLNVGPVVNLAFAARGRFIHPDFNEPLSLETDGNYRRNLGFGLMSSLSINYKIGKRDPFILLVEPFFKGYPTAFTVKNAPLRESYWAAGVQFGVRKGF